MLTTGAMVRMGKTYSNLMVDLRASNVKLTERATRIVETLTGLSGLRAGDLLKNCNGEVKTAVVSYQLNLSPELARERLDAVEGHLRKALESRPADSAGKAL
jgi:N-acetylmuramic acid 6-phosphate etherase